MIELFGLEGYTGHKVASDLMVQEQILVLQADGMAQKEQQKRDRDELDKQARGY